MKISWHRWILYSAALVNIAAPLLVSRGFTNNALGAQFPALFSFWGLGVIMLWGAAYAAVAHSNMPLRPIMAVFIAQKIIYVFSWLGYLERYGNQLGTLLQSDFLTAVFMALYGAVDLIFALLFLFIFIQKRD